MSDTRRQNFITDIIDEDLRSGKHDRIVTRFPPEPNGYLHIGHAKSICLNFGLAQQYQGRCHLRFDDTNPTKEETEYVESIQEDVRWLGFDWGEHLYFASDYFERMYELAEVLIRKGKAYVDSADRETMRAHRGTLTEAGTPTPDRDRGAEENLDLFQRMRAGEFADGAFVLRAKIDLSNANMLMRDPVLYRIQHAHHHRTGDDWCIYPMYDYAHCLEDAFEGVTHSICTLEFENNRELYDWVIAETEVAWVPRQYEFARLSIEYWMMSKRKLIELVRDGHVDGWSDPRMPTIAAMRRRGVRPEAVRRFAEMVGVAKANSQVETELFDFAVRDDLNMVAPRVMCVTDPLKVTITNWPAGEVDWLDASYYPHDVPLEGERQVPFDGTLYIERDDFMEDPPKKYFRLAPGREVRLRYGYYVTCDEVVRGDDGEVIELRCSYDPQTRGGSSPDGRKVKGTIHWVSAAHAIPCELRLYERLFAVPNPEGDDDLNPDSLVVRRGFIEPSVRDDDADVRYQFERQGYFWRDPQSLATGDSTPDALVFNRIVALRDSWKKQQPAREDADTIRSIPAIVRETEAAAAKGDDRPQKRSAAYERQKARDADAALAARYDRYLNQLGLDDDEADLLSGEQRLAEYFEAVVAAYDAPYAVSKWIANTLLPALGERDVATVPATDVAALVKMTDDDRITSAVSGDVAEAMIETGQSPEAIVKERNLEKLADAASLQPIIATVLQDNPDELARYRDGKKALFGFFIGKVMQATGGAADASVVRELLQDSLG